MQVSDVVQAQSTLQKVAQASLPISLAHSLLKVLKEAGEIVSIFEQQKMEIVREIGEQNEETQQYSIPDANKGSFEQKILGLLEQEVTLPEVKVKIEDLEPHIKLSVSELNTIIWLIDE